MTKQQTPMRSGVLWLALAAALGTAVMSSGAMAAHRRGSHWRADHLHRHPRGVGRPFFSRSFRRFASELDLWDLGGGWWAGYNYCGGWRYELGYAPYSCYIYGGW